MLCRKIARHRAPSLYYYLVDGGEGVPLQLQISKKATIVHAVAGAEGFEVKLKPHVQARHVVMSH